MKSIRFAILLSIFVFVLIAGLSHTGISAEKSQGQWTVVIPETVFGEKVRMASFLNAKFGITGGAGDVGKASFTPDGGKTWVTADSSGG